MIELNMEGECYDKNSLDYIWTRAMNACNFTDSKVFLNIIIYTRGDNSSSYDYNKATNVQFAQILMEEHRKERFELELSNIEYNLKKRLSLFEGEVEIAFTSITTVDNNTGRGDIWNFRCCDMLFKEEHLGTQHLTDFLKELSGIDKNDVFYAFQTTNSFHIYGTKINPMSKWNTWLNHLKRLNRKYLGVIDEGWVYHPQKRYALRINSTLERDVPLLWGTVSLPIENIGC